jgi:hypothetical protein
MKAEPFKQGPMSASEAENLSTLYKSKGRTVVVVDAMEQPGQKYVYVTLPCGANEPKRSNQYQQRAWS